MTDIENKLNTLKDGIFESNLDSATDDNVSLNRIIKLRDVDADLKEALILLTNNYTAELQAIKNHQVKTLVSIIDTDISILHKYKNVLIEVNAIKAHSKKPKLTWANTYKITGLVIGVLVSFTLLYHLEPTAFDKAILAFVHMADDVSKLLKLI